MSLEAGSASYLIRRADREDLTAIERIQDYSPEATRWNVEDYLGHKTLVAVSGAGQILGFLMYRNISTDEREILNLAVAPAARRRGVATALLDGTLKDWKGVVFLEVRSRNHPALRLYSKYGFVPAGIRRRYYQNSGEDAVVLRLQSC